MKGWVDMKISDSEKRKYMGLKTTRPSECIEQLYAKYDMKFSITKDEWREKLTDEAYHILFEQGTELAFANAYYDNTESGIYYCGACGYPLFGSEAKYDSKTGWPSFSAPLKPQAVEYTIDFSIFQPRTEVHCARCAGHLGHVFDDGLENTGLRYCLNSGALIFHKE